MLSRFSPMASELASNSEVSKAMIHSRENQKVGPQAMNTPPIVTAQQSLGADEIAKLRHGDAAQRQRRRIVAQRHPLQCPERITSGERMGCGCDQRVH